MTTIACNRKMMAADSLCDHGSSKRKHCKIYVVKTKNGYSAIGGAGTSTNILRFIKWISLGKNFKEIPRLFDDKELTVIELTDQGKIYYWDYSFTPLEVEEDFFSVGSGSPWAIGAMEHGASPEQAVNIAILHDDNSGYPIKTILIQDLSEDHEYYQRTNEILERFNI